MAEAVIRLLRHHQPRSLSPSSPSSSSSSHLESSINSTTSNLTFLSHQLRLSENDSRPPPPFSFTFPTDLNSTFFFDDDESSSLSSTSSSSSLFSEQLSNALLIFSYSLIVLVSLFGNTFVCRVMLSLKGANRTRTNFLILNLALSDLLLTTFNIPVNIIRFVSSDWPFGELICKATPFIQSLSAHCSAITMMIIAYERHSRLIGTNPATALWRTLKRLLCSCLSWLSTRLAQSLRNSTGSGGNSSETQTYLRNSSANSSTNSNGSSHQNGGQVAISIPGGNGGGQSHSVINTGSGNSFRLPTPVLIIIIWLVSALLSSPHGLVNKVVIYQGVFHDMTRCQAKYPSAGFHTFLSVVTPISQYLAPIGATALFYARIGHFLWRRTDPVGVVSEGRRQSILRRKRKRVKMLVVVVVVFAVCWAPLHFYVTLVDFGIIQINFAIYFCVHWFACSSVVWNPFIYCWLNETFRRKMTPLLAVFRPFKVCVERLLALCSCCFAAGRRKGNKATPAGGAAAAVVCRKGGRSASTVISTTADGQCAVVEVESVKTSSSISSSSSTKNLHCCSGGGGGGFMSAICGGTKEGVGVRASIKTFSSGGGGGGGGDHHKPPRGGPRRPSASSACSGSRSGGEGSSPPVETTMVTATAILEMGEMFEEVENNEQQQQQQLKQ